MSPGRQAEATDWDLLWPELSAVTLMGTGRRRMRGWPTLGYEPRPGGSAEEQLLDLAALGQAARAAGAVLTTATFPEPAAPDRLADPPATAVQLLEVLVNQNPVGNDLRPYLIDQWSDAAAAAGCHVPSDLLVPLMTIGDTDRRVRRAILPIIDSRGHWLATSQRRWAWATAATEDEAAIDPATWPTLTISVREPMLRALRRRDPAAGLAIVESTWGSEAARDRVTMVEALAENLSQADEDFLERVLDDPAQSVRQATIALLAALPLSRFAQRMQARLEALVRQRGILRKTIEVELPDDPDEAGRRDGLREISQGSRRSFWLKTIIISTPLQFWSQFGRPSAVLGMIADEEVKHALGSAVRAQSNPGYGSSGPTNDAWIEVLAARGDATAFGRLPLDQRHRLAPAVLGRSDAVDRLPQIIAALEGPWSAELSRQVLQLVIDHKRYHTAVPENFAIGLHPDVTRTIPDRVSTVEEKLLRSHLQSVVTFQSLRTAIREAF